MISLRLSHGPEELPPEVAKYIGPIITRLGDVVCFALERRINVEVDKLVCGKFIARGLIRGILWRSDEVKAMRRIFGDALSREVFEAFLWLVLRRRPEMWLAETVFSQGSHISEFGVEAFISKRGRSPGMRKHFYHVAQGN